MCTFTLSASVNVQNVYSIVKSAAILTQAAANIAVGYRLDSSSIQAIAS